MKVVRVVGAVLVACIALALLAFLGVAFFLAQRADYGWVPRVEAPAFRSAHPRVLFDEGHHNASSAGFAGRYFPFAQLLRADGFSVQRGKQPFTPELLDGVQILVIANASGGPKPQFFGINLPIRTDKKRSDPAFTDGEIRVIRSWVERGGSLLLIADHAPFGEAAEALGSALGVTMHKGFVEVPGEPSDPLVFSNENGRLGDHPIVHGDGPGTDVQRVMTYTGQSLDGPSGAVELLRLPDTAVESVPAEGDLLVPQPAGRAQGLAMELGGGRVVVLGEGAMVTAQVDHRERYGMNTADNDNRRLVLNLMHWLSRKI